MFHDKTKRHAVPTSLLFAALFALAAVPPTALYLMQQQAHEPVPYLTIELEGEPSPVAGEGKLEPLSAER